MISKKWIKWSFLALTPSFSFAQTYKDMMEDSSYSLYEIQKEAEAYFKNKDKGRGSGFKQYKRWEYNAILMSNEQGFQQNEQTYLEEFNRVSNLVNQELSAKSYNANNSNSNWTEIGPTSYDATTGWNPGVGRVTSISIENNNDQHILVGGPTGGVWKTTNKGQDWTPLTDNFSTMDVYSLAIDPKNPDIYYWGSDNGYIYKSIDGGQTWNTSGGYINNSRINKILVHPENSNLIFASIESRGFYRSTDAGASWNKVSDSSSAYDIQLKADDPNTIFISGTKVYKSTDLGLTFTELSGGFSSGAKMIGVSENDPNKIYVIEASNGKFNALYSSTNAGDSFTKLDHGTKNYFGYSTSGSDSRGQAPRDMGIAVSPNNADELHIAGINTWRSLDGGVSFEPTSDWTPGGTQSLGIGYCHADVDLLFFYNDKLIVGSDGGIFIAEDTNNLNTNYYTDITNGLGIRQFYRIGTSQSENPVITGGAQDNGSSFYQDNQWKDFLGADGMESFVKLNDPNTLFGTSQMGNLYRYNVSNASYTSLNTGKEGNWITPIEKHPVDENTIYAGYNQIYKSTDNGNSWDSDSNTFVSGKNIDHLEISQSNPNFKVVAVRDQLFRYDESLVENPFSTPWVESTGFSGNISSVSIHPSNPNKIAIATNSSEKVYISEDGGITWNSKKLNLPNFTAISLTWQDIEGSQGLYLGMNYGVYFLDLEENTWLNYMTNLPNVSVYELEINYPTNTLYAGTYGRGLWATPLINLTLSTEDFKIDQTKIYPNPASKTLNINLSKSDKYTTQVYDLKGRIIIENKQENPSNSMSLNIQALPKGIYFLRITNNNGKQTVKKFLKK